MTMLSAGERYRLSLIDTSFINTETVFRHKIIMLHQIETTVRIVLVEIHQLNL